LALIKRSSLENIEDKIIALATAVAVIFTALVVVLSVKPPVVVNGQGATVGKAVRSVDLSLLTKKSPEYPGVKKNIFSPLRKPLPPRPKPPVVVAPKPIPKAAPVSKVRLFVNMLEFMGFLDNADGVTVFIAFKDDVYLLKEGDKVDGKFGEFSLARVSESSIEFVDDITGERASIIILDGAKGG
jgi:hypothetical protein